MSDTQAIVKINDLSAAQKMIVQYMTAFTDSKSAQHFMAQVNLAMRKNVALAACDPQSIFEAAMACAHLELPPNTPEGYAYIIPYGKVAQFQLGYKGLVELAYRSGVVKTIAAELVFPDDEFRVELGTERRLVHNPSWKNAAGRTYDKAIALYATAILNNGETVFEVMTKEDVDKIKRTSKAGTSGPWKEWPEQMAKKTVVKRLLKLLPASAADNRFKVAAEWDSSAEAGKRLVVDSQTNDLVELDEGAPDQEVLDAIAGAASRQDIQDTLNLVDARERLKYTEAANARLAELKAEADKKPAEK
jgi:recombination protein RecT